MLVELLKYTQKADEIMLNAYEQIDFSISEANRLIGHILSAQHIWAHRMLALVPEYGVWHVFPPSQFKEISAANFRLLFDVLTQVDLNETTSYQNAKGETFSNKIEDVFFHLCNHGTYHRAQLATLLRQAGETPPITDYIILKRQNLI